MNKKISLFTSINPNTNNLREIVKTWECFDEIFSLNSDKEISLLKDKLPKINFIESNLYNGKYASVNDVLESQSICAKNEYVAFINSDIYVDKIEDLMEGKLNFSQRINIDSLNKKYNRKTFIHGFDYFCYPKSNINVILPSKLHIGMPWWDYFVPYCFLKKGIGCHLMTKSKLLHFRHSFMASDEQHTHYGNLMKEALGHNQDMPNQQYGQIICKLILEEGLKHD